MRLIRRDERGATIVIVALSVIALLAVTGLAIDGGRLYSDRRQVQNAADAAALAGTVALNTLTTGNEASIYNAVQARVTQNEAFDTFTCQIIDEAGTVLQTCPTSNGTAVNGSAAGVKVVAKNTQNTSFMRAAGISTFSASANAAATLQKLVPSGGAGPIMICGVLKSDPRWGPDTSGDEQTPPILLADDTLNPAALYNPSTGTGPVYWIKGVEVKKTCTQGANWKGLSDGGQYQLPGAWHTDNGNKAGPTRVKVSGACGDPDVVGCRVVLPICYWRSDIPSDWMWCVRFAVFQITFSDSNSIKAGIIGNAVVEGGQGGGKPNDPIEPRVIKLVQ